MDPQTSQILSQLAQLFQQGLTLLQQAQQGGGGGDDGGGMAPPDMGEGSADMDAEGGAPPDPDMMGGGDGDMGGGMDDGDEGGDSLHDRVRDLESHTGLAKAAQSGSLSDRIDDLEDEILGQQYEGPMPDRLTQLEKAAGVTRRASGQRQTAPESADWSQQQAPDEIPLDTLIKSAIQEGIAQGLATQRQQPDYQNGNIPNPQALRKSAAATANQQGRKGRQPHLQSDDDLVKAAKQWGMEGDLDAPATFGDLLQLQYNAQMGGGTGPLDDGED